MTWAPETQVRKAYTHPAAGLSVVMIGFSPSFFRFLLIAATVAAADTDVGELIPLPLLLLLLLPLPFAPEAVAAAAAFAAAAAAEAVVIEGVGVAVTVAGVMVGASWRACCILTVGVAPLPVVSPTPPEPAVPAAPPALCSLAVGSAVLDSVCG